MQQAFAAGRSQNFFVCPIVSNFGASQHCRAEYQQRQSDDSGPQVLLTPYARSLLQAAVHARTSTLAILAILLTVEGYVQDRRLNAWHCVTQCALLLCCACRLQLGA